jgi:2-oxoglutarate ferredoxin oxidoreductase subunit alpha
MERLNRKFETARSFVPRPKSNGQIENRHHRLRHVALGHHRSRDQLRNEYSIETDYLRLRPIRSPAKCTTSSSSTTAFTWSSRTATRRCSACSSSTSKPRTHHRAAQHRSHHGLPLDARSVTDELMTMEGK